MIVNVKVFNLRCFIIMHLFTEEHRYYFVLFRWK